LRFVWFAKAFCSPANVFGRLGEFAMIIFKKGVGEIRFYEVKNEKRI